MAVLLFYLVALTALLASVTMTVVAIAHHRKQRKDVSGEGSDERRN